ncbi:hypothetical protein RhiirA1_469601 [Rhizophagus irregularis]|uniref:Uncharacterized protein n=1 Tax=Rhizophagus irregularis TaxID=588596 RepID=A0A2N0R7R1_9GLOM|nr:hypothetical protein RhiirA1_469601 [Rhizophagus irregularis]
MSLHFNTFIDNNNGHESNSEFIDNSLQQPYYENVSDTTGDYVTVQNSNIQESISTSDLQYHQASLQHDEHVQQNDFVPAQHDYDNAIPQLNTRPAVHMQNIDNNHRISRSQFQPDDDLNESFRSIYDN